MSKNENVSKRKLKLVNIDPSKPRAVRKGTKTWRMLTAMRRSNGITLEALAKLFSDDSGYVCTPAYARSWVTYVGTELGFGVRSEYTATGQVKVFLIEPDGVTINDVAVTKTKTKAAKPESKSKAAKQKSAKKRAKKTTAPATPAETPEPAESTETPNPYGGLTSESAETAAA